MLTLNDGRSELWQWDTGRKLNVDADCSQVHFSNKVFGRSIDVDVVDGVATIPDILLQSDKDLSVWAFVGTSENGYTKISKTFKVNRRNKPADYVFTPPDQTSLEELNERIDELEEKQEPAIKNAVEDYLEQNPVDFPVDSVNGQTGEVKLTAGDVGAISQDDLQEATREALAQAKASGEFDGADGQPGADGITPRVGSNGNWFIGDNDTGIPATGPAGGQGLPGVPGEDGQPGKDGTSPTVSVSAIEGGHRITITDANGTNTVDVLNGTDGQPGKDGADGAPGEKGEKGEAGPQGPQGIPGVAVQTDGYVTFNVTEDGILQCTYTGDVPPNYSINDDGHLILTI